MDYFQIMFAVVFIRKFNEYHVVSQNWLLGEKVVRWPQLAGTEFLSALRQHAELNDDIEELSCEVIRRFREFNFCQYVLFRGRTVGQGFLV